MAEAQQEIYKFVRDRHDKLLSARGMAQTRIGHLLVLTGFLVTLLVSTGIPQLILAIERTNHVATTIVCIAATFSLVITFVLIGMLVYELSRAISRFAFALPDANPNIIRANITFPGLVADEVLPELTNLYLDAIESNGKEAGTMGQHLERSLRWLNAGLISGAFFVGLLITARITIVAMTPP